MPIARTGDLIHAAREAGRGIGAFNVISLEHCEAIVRGAERAGLPVILQISQNAVAYHSALRPVASACLAIAESADVPVSLHLDHATSMQLCQEAVQAGFSSVMYDASESPYEENVAATARLAAWAHRNGLYIEAELGVVGGKGGAHAPDARTDPAEAADYVTRTEVDALAVAVGTSHAMVEHRARVDLGLIGRLRSALTVPLVLHGSSGVPHHLLVAAVGRGITKINIGTELNKAMTARIRSILEEQESVVDPRKYLGPARTDAAVVVEGILTLLATVGLRQRGNGQVA